MHIRQGGSQGKWLVSVATRGRHFGVITIILNLVVRLISRALIRKNSRCVRAWCLKSHKECETLCVQRAGLYKKDIIMQPYEHATQEPSSFLFVRLGGKTRRDGFY